MTEPQIESLSPLEPAVPAPGDDAAVDQMVLRYAIVAGALELLPQSFATVAILPLQLRMVYRVGLHYGVSLDRGHAKEFLATAGAGLASQVVERFARRLVGRLVGRIFGGGVGRLGQAAAGAALTFAGTWALGMAAKSYYAGGRRLDTRALRELFARKLGDGRALFRRHEAEIRERVRTLDLGAVADLARGR